MKISNELKIGFWALVALAVLYYGVMYLKGINSFKTGDFYYMTCQKIDGVAISSHVKVNGYRVGQVRSMDYDYEKGVVVLLLNTTDSDLRIPRDSRVSVKSDLLGTSDIVIELGQEKDCYACWDTIHASNSAPSLLDQAGPMLDQVSALMPKIDSLITGINLLVNESKLHESLLEINTMSSHLNQTVNQLNSLLRKDVPAIMSNVESATANIDTLSTQLKEAEIQKLLANTNQAIEQVNLMLTEMQSDTTTMGKLLKTSELHDQLTNTIADMDSLINDIKQNPKRYIHIKVF